MSAIHTLSVVGLGLLGGSVALAARRRRAAARILGTDHCPAALDRAREAGLLDEAVTGLRPAVEPADVVVFCAPVDAIARLALSAAPFCRPGALLTDVGSTKARIVQDLDGRLPPGVDFVGAHPLAGSEKHGLEHARADLFDGRLVLLTPGPATERAALERARAFWESLGARAQTMAPEEHDRALALTSHLPHLVASALAGTLPPEWRGLTGTGFRDTARLAAGPPAVWAPVFRANRAAVLDALGRLEGQLARFREALGGEEALLEALLVEGKRARDGLPPA
jgi:prephenate dehydrogenase